MNRDERELIQRIRNGDRDAFRTVVESYGPRILTAVRRLTGRAREAQDITQDVFVKAFRAIKKYDQRHAFSTWLYRIAVNTAIDAMRKISANPVERTDDEELKRIPGASGGSPERRYETKEAILAVERLACRLTLKQRAVFILRDLHGLTTEEAGRVMGCRESTVRVHLANARNRMRELLFREYPELCESYRKKEQSDHAVQ